MTNSNPSTTEKNLEQMLVDCSIDAIIAVDETNTIIAWNVIAEKIYGQKKDEVIGKNLTEIVPSVLADEETQQAIRLALKGIKSFVPASKRFPHREHVENHFIPLKEGDQIVGVMNLVHDVSHRIKAEEKLQYLNDELERRFRQLQVASGELAAFTYLSSNKIKEPIQHVYTSIEFLIKTEASRLTDSGKASLRRIQSSINRMNLLLDDILSLSQISILEKTETLVDLYELIGGIIATLKKKSEKNARFTCEKLCSIKGHRQYLHILFYNLLDNAVKFNENDTAIVNINCETVCIQQENNIVVSELEYYKVTVSDNGIGIADADKDRIFRMFEKLHDKTYKGSGMGLTIAQKIMHAHGGYIQVESVPGKGSAFHCFFPNWN